MPDLFSWDTALGFLTILAVLQTAWGLRRSLTSNEVFAQHRSLISHHMMTMDEDVLPHYLQALRDSSTAIDDETAAARLYFLLATKLSHYESLMTARPAIIRGRAKSSADEWQRVVEELVRHDLYRLYWTTDRLTFTKKFRGFVDKKYRPAKLSDDSMSSRDGLLRFCEAISRADWGKTV